MWVPGGDLLNRQLTINRKLLTEFVGTADGIFYKQETPNGVCLNAEGIFYKQATRSRVGLSSIGDSRKSNA